MNFLGHSYSIHLKIIFVKRDLNALLFTILHFIWRLFTIKLNHRIDHAMRNWNESLAEKGQKNGWQVMVWSLGNENGSFAKSEKCKW